MKPSKISSSKLNPIYLKVITVGWLGLSLIGFLDTTYLTIQHYRGFGLDCGPLFECDAVMTSQYAVIGGIPLALLGTLYYLAVFLLTVAYYDRKNIYILSIIARLTILGFLVSLILAYLLAFIIRAFCFYCLLSALTSTGLFILGMIYRVRLKMGYLTVYPLSKSS
jgi:uncharacterized membrane protein